MGKTLSKLVFKTSYERIPDPPPSFFSISMKDIEGNLVNFETFKD